MKKIKVLSCGVLGVFLLGGCAQRELMFTQDTICQAPIAKIFFQNVIQKEKNQIFHQDEIKKIMTQVIKNTGCFELVGSSDNPDYVVNAVYDTKVTAQNQKETFKTQTSNDFRVKVTLHSSNAQILRQDFGESIIQTQENKVLGIGEDEKISLEDEIKALKNSTLVALKGLITSLQGAQKTLLETSQDKSSIQE